MPNGIEIGCDRLLFKDILAKQRNVLYIPDHPNANDRPVMYR